MIAAAYAPDDFRVPPPPKLPFDHLDQRRRQIYALNKQMKARDEAQYEAYSGRQNARAFSLAACLLIWRKHRCAAVLQRFAEVVVQLDKTGSSSMC